MWGVQWVVQQQDAGRAPAEMAAGVEAAPIRRFPAAASGVALQEMAGPHSARLACRSAPVSRVPKPDDRHRGD